MRSPGLAVKFDGSVSRRPILWSFLATVAIAIIAVAMVMLWPPSHFQEVRYQAHL